MRCDALYKARHNAILIRASASCFRLPLMSKIFKKTGSRKALPFLRMTVEEGIRNESQVRKTKKLKRKKKRVKTSIFKTLRPSASDGISPRVAKYWYQRYSLFSRYDDGIKMDEEGWFSVTPEDIATRHAERSGPGAVIDCFAGVGGNSIQFARRCNYVLAIEIDPQKVGMAFNNAKIYGVENYIDFVVGDFFQLAPFLKGDVVFLSPPWGGPTYSGISNYTLDFLKPKDGYSMFQVAQRITPNVIMFLPRNVDSNQVEELSWLSSPPLNVEIEENYVESYLKGVSAYFGDTAWRSPALS